MKWDTVEQILERPYVYLECPKCNKKAQVNEAIEHEENCEDFGFY